ncbi:MAG TPA: thioredoxin domain-containing protein, partial [Pyrinomonadaceae bacterium]|nr:thioredoxin domain-containing protein [Pyrinomonadaceae bacterium]
TLEFLLHVHYRTHSDETLAIITETCRKMAEGGMYDQLGGGFHRYSVDAKWLVPHFEKMLYDNALLSRLYLHVYQVTHDEFYRRIAEEILDYVRREMTDSSGGFYSSQDADSEGEEGKFFVWSRREIIDALGESDGAIFSDYYDVTDQGNFEGQNILHVKNSIEAVASKHDVSIERAREIIETGRRALFDIRESRVKPGRDEKILTAWNGLMLASFAEASALLDRADYGEVARANAKFLLSHLKKEGLLLRTYKAGESKLNAYLEDYANLVHGLIALYESTGELEWFQNALQLTDKMIEQFWDDEAGGFFFTGKSHEQLIVRSKEWLDNATPSGNSVAAFSLLRLALLTANEDYRRRATTILRLMADQIRRYPSAFGFALTALDFYLSSPLEVAIVGARSDTRLSALIQAFWHQYLPNRVLALCSTSFDDAVSRIPLLEGRNTLETQPTAFVCEGYACKSPALSSDELAKQLILK